MQLNVELDVIKACAHKTIEELNNLKKTRQDLEYNLRALNARRDDVKTKRSAELRQGKEIRREVENWFNDVEQIKDEAQKNERLIKLLCAPENIVRIVVATSSKSSTSMENDSRNVSIFGVGGVGNTSIRAEHSIIRTNIAKVETTHHHHYHDKGTN